MGFLLQGSEVQIFLFISEQFPKNYRFCFLFMASEEAQLFPVQCCLLSKAPFVCQAKPAFLKSKESLQGPVSSLLVYLDGSRHETPMTEPLHSESVCMAYVV